MQCLKPGISKNTHLNCIISNFCFILHSNLNIYEVKEVCCPPPPPALYSNDPATCIPTFHFLLSLDVSLLEAVVVDAAVVAAAAVVVVVEEVDAD